MTRQTIFANPQDARAFTLAGNATITLESQKTGAHFTYRVRQALDRETEKPTDRYFVSVLNGPDNEHSFAYVGLLDGGSFRQTAKSRFAADTPSVRGFVYFWNAIAADRMPNTMNVRHEGKCGRCNRKLTTPESLDRGIGPECAAIMGIHTHAHSECAA